MSREIGDFLGFPDLTKGVLPRVVGGLGRGCDKV